MAGVIFVSVPTIFDSRPEKVVDPLIKGITNTLVAAASAGVQRYVLNSSSKSADSTNYHKPARELSVDTLNDEAINDMQAGSSKPSFERIVIVYSAARTLSEQAFWKWIQSNKPPFVANCVVPDGQFGRVLDIHPVDHGISSNSQLKNALLGNWSAIGLPLGECSAVIKCRMWFNVWSAFWADVQDSAKLMVAALTSKSIRN